MQGIEIFAIVLLIILCMLSSAAGVGGGSVIVPICLIIMDFDTKQSVALANGLTFFLALVKCSVGLAKKNPLIKHKTLIDYNIVLIFISSILIGSLVGSLIARILSDLL